MSRKLILSLALGTLVATALLSGSANAMGGHGGNGHNIPNSHPHPHPYPHPHPNWHPTWHPQVHFRPVYERGYVRTVGVAAPVAEGLCTCLTKGYTPDGLVVFKDLCTKEMASAPVNGAPGQASEKEPVEFCRQDLPRLSGRQHAELGGSAVEEPIGSADGKAKGPSGGNTAGGLSLYQTVVGSLTS